MSRYAILSREFLKKDSIAVVEMCSYNKILLFVSSSLEQQHETKLW